MTASSRVADGRSRRQGVAALLVLPTALWYVGFLVAPLVVLMGMVGFVLLIGLNLVVCRLPAAKQVAHPGS